MADRYQSADAVLSDLHRLTDRKPLGSRGALWIAAASIGLVGLVGLITLRSRTHSDLATGVARFSNPVQLTSSLGVEDFPDWSPDGKSVVYQASQSGSSDIWVLTFSTRKPINRTPEYRGQDRFPSFSPDGRRIAFWSDREGEGFFVMDAFSGPARKVVSAERLGPAHWSADGTRLTYGAFDGKEAGFETVSLVDGETWRSKAPGHAVRRVYPRWSRDEKLVAYLHAPYYNSAVHPLVLFRPGDGHVFSITDGSTRIFDHTFSADGRELFFVSNRGGSQDLWQQSLRPDGEPSGEPRRVTTGMGIRSAAVSPDGTRLAYSQGRRVSNLVRVPILEHRPATWDDAEQLTFDQSFIGFVSVSADGRRLYFSSDRNGNQDLWTMPAGGGEMTQLTTDPAPDFSPVESPDGKSLLFYSNRSGNRDIWVLPLKGGPARQLTDDPAEDYHPDWSPDGRFVAFTSTRGGSRDVWVAPAEGGEPRVVAPSPKIDVFPKWSPDGASLVFSHRARARLGALASACGRRRAKEAYGGPLPLSLLVPRRGVGVFHGRQGKTRGNLWRVSRDGKTLQQVTDLDPSEGFIGGLALATDGTSLYFACEEDLGNLWTVDLKVP